MRILAIETSCDDTGVAIIEAKGGFKKPSFNVLANTTSSQIALHAKYGGVFPMMAKREHAKNLTPILEQVLRQSKLYEKNLKPTTYNLQPTTFSRLLHREPELLADLSKLLPKVKRPDIDAIAVTSLGRH
jgi:N6-L-threonylcarbamoyladenine synthase